MKEDVLDEAKKIYKKNHDWRETALSLLDIRDFKKFLEITIGNEFDISQWIENELIDEETGELKADKIKALADLYDHTMMRIDNIIGKGRNYKDLDESEREEAIEKFDLRLERITKPEKFAAFKKALKERGFTKYADEIKTTKMSANKNIETLEKEIADIDKQMKEAAQRKDKEDFDNLREIRRDKEDQITKELEREERIAELDEIESKIKSVKYSMTDKEKKDEIKDDIDDWKGDIDVLKDDVKDLKKEIVQIDKMMNESEKELDKLEKKNDPDDKDEIREVKEVMKEDIKDRASIEKDIKDFEKEIADIEQDIEKNKKKLKSSIDAAPKVEDKEQDTSKLPVTQETTEFKEYKRRPKELPEEKRESAINVPDNVKETFGELKKTIDEVDKMNSKYEDELSKLKEKYVPKITDKSKRSDELLKAIYNQMTAINKVNDIVKLSDKAYLGVMTQLEAIGKTYDEKELEKLAGLQEKIKALNSQLNETKKELGRYTENMKEITVYTLESQVSEVEVMAGEVDNIETLKEGKSILDKIADGFTTFINILEDLGSKLVPAEAAKKTSTDEIAKLEREAEDLETPIGEM